MNAQVYKHKTILVTGGAGSIGKELISQLLQCNPKVIRSLDHSEGGTYELKNALGTPSNFRPLIGDIRDKKRVSKAMIDVDIVFHAAALKHVDLCEYNPFEAIATNVTGTENLIEAAINKGVKKFIAISTDKAANPVNIMGTTKLLSEKLTTSAFYHRGSSNTTFAAVRFGNVIGSNGSVIPHWIEQIKSGQPVTITHTDMTRFMMSIQEAISLVLKTQEYMQQGEVFVLKMPAVKMKDVAQVLIKEICRYHQLDEKKIKLITTGIRAGEKLHEELLTLEESRFAYQTDGLYAILPRKEIVDLPIKQTDYPFSIKARVKSYASNTQKPLSKLAIKKMLIKAGVFPWLQI